MPVFWFSWSVSPIWIWWKVGLVFIILHIFLYPASNAFNSYYDKDEDSIGGLKHPPKVTDQLLWTALAFDGIALLLGLLLGWWFVAGLFIYGLASKAYSYDKIRLKKYPVVSWIIAGFFQGFFTFIMVYQALNATTLTELIKPPILIPASLSTALLMGFYPMTQIYQHEEDARRGDMTMSRLLGIKGTFIFTALVFLTSTAGFYFYFQTYHSFLLFVLFQVFLAPGLIFFVWWFLQVNKDISKADFEATMKLNLTSSVGTNLFFIISGLIIHSVL
jgi:1,4-dihydroxy-2-naphthoate octaprenyltransferase